MVNIRMLRLDFHLSIMKFLTKLTGDITPLSPWRGVVGEAFLIVSPATLAILPIVLETRSGPWRDIVSDFAVPE